jgi:hypothetical protein
MWVRARVGSFACMYASVCLLRVGSGSALRAVRTRTNKGPVTHKDVRTRTHTQAPSEAGEGLGCARACARTAFLPMAAGDRETQAGTGTGTRTRALQQN